MDLPTIWFIVIAFFWTGYFVLEGFDFGVGALLPALGRRTPTTKDTMLATIGPVWDGNEVWLIVAAGATFAAFPAWYATLFSGFYLPLLAILLALIIRAVALEYRGKRPDPTWRRRCDLAITTGSLVPAFGWGLIFANLTDGVALDAQGHHTGALTDLLTPYNILGGATTLTLFLTHGAIFTALKTTGDLRHTATRAATRLGLATTAIAGTFLTWTAATHDRPIVTALAATATATLCGAVIANHRRREGIAFTATTVTIAAATATLFTAIFPDVIPADDPANSLTVAAAASSPYTLKIMTIAAAVFTPLVLAYQTWTYWVFRKRLTAPPAGH
ncbi:cytochrome d ubiquinol oxidase subunit II [Stackebrandtia albiflava]|uniref:Cytochrome d ubiquinol oxidase subunit II n=1 Tax=Stackebrandtia albiflava TaxID=406432 RepID=A0A562VDC7_9ACTN|nr:cytochrome d ubiquinol oxidase subunit II [Stackebrandtia albiflava]TWJ15872.1 cytochrome d ubiquinol oxidase subunit II [Stackebrandtia albiflava]